MPARKKGGKKPAKKKRVFKKKRVAKKKKGTKVTDASHIFPARKMVKSSCMSDWQTLAFAGGGACLVATVKANSIYRPIAGLPAAPLTTYNGLPALISSVAGGVNSIYKYARVHSTKLEVWVSRATAPVNSLRVGGYTHPIPGNTGSVSSFPRLEQQKGMKVMTAMNNETKDVKYTLFCNVQKMMGLKSAEFYGDPTFGQQATVDPTNTLYYNLLFQPMLAAAEASAVWTYRVRLHATIELSDPWANSDDVGPTFLECKEPESDDQAEPEFVEAPPQTPLKSGAPSAAAPPAVPQKKQAGSALAKK